MAFNEAQLCAIRHTDGPMLVLAGPGSGKTTVIVNRILHLVEKQGAGPGEILVITFTRAAAQEMQKRYEKERRSSREAPAAAPVFGTFHSVFFSILQTYLGFTPKNIIKTEEQQAVLRKILERPDIPAVYTEDLAGLLLAEISRAKNCGLSRSFVPGACDPGLFFRIYEAYGKMLLCMRLLDFDDMLLLCLTLFRKRPEILARERKRFRYILVDEFQDINQVQYDIVRLLAAPENNLFIVGDDDQSIYGFRGSKPGIMLRFPEDYPGCRRVLLDQNYRSGGEIIEAALRLIEHNRSRFPKELRPGRSLAARVSVQGFENEQAEYEALSALIRRYLGQGIPLSEMAVLYRTNGEAPPPRAFLRGQGFSELPVFSSFHGAKGLEFTVVFLIDANEGITPHGKNKGREELEEERRMFYVAMTRARQFLHIFYTNSRYNRPQKQSRFVRELREERRGVHGRIKGFGSRR